MRATKNTVNSFASKRWLKSYQFGICSIINQSSNQNTLHEGKFHLNIMVLEVLNSIFVMRSGHFPTTNTWRVLCKHTHLENTISIQSLWWDAIALELITYVYTLEDSEPVNIVSRQNRDLSKSLKSG